MPARALTRTIASGSDGPKIRLMQAGRYTAAAPSRTVAGSGGAGGGASRGSSGTSSSARSVRTAREAARPTAGARRPARLARSTVCQWAAMRAAAFSASGVCWRARSSLTILPVSIPSGQTRRHEPSAAHVSSASYSYSSISAAVTGEPAGWRAISRRSTIRWRGVVVSQRDGHTGSQNPHSTQVVASSSIGGVDCRSFRWTSGSRFSTTPGFSTPSGSHSALTRHIMSVAFAPHSRSTNGAMLRPVPCSALSEPS